MRRLRVTAGPVRIAIGASISIASNPRPSGRPGRTRRRVLAIGLPLFTALGALAVTTGLLNTSGGAGAPSAALSPSVRFTGKAPTGYTVTFRYRDASAKSVVIQGEWYFSNPALTTPTSSQGLLPSQWKAGDIATGWPAPSTPDGWPLASMKKDPRTGVWSYTTPLPSGYYNYGFYPDCNLDEALASPDAGVSCPNREIADPGNPPWNDRRGVSTGSTDGRSQVYVPADRAFDDVNYSWEGANDTKGCADGRQLPLNCRRIGPQSPRHELPRDLHAARL